jgi:hypothetical protein
MNGCSHICASTYRSKWSEAIGRSIRLGRDRKAGPRARRARASAEFRISVLKLIPVTSSPRIDQDIGRRFWSSPGQSTPIWKKRQCVLGAPGGSRGASWVRQRRRRPDVIRRGATRSAHCQFSSLMFALLTTFANFSMSDLISAANCSGPPGNGSTPCALSLSFTSGRA